MEDQVEVMEEETPQVDETVEENSTEEEPEVNAVKKERTAKQIEKLKEHNQQLKEERDSYKSLFESSRPVEATSNSIPPITQFQNLNQTTVDQTVQSMVDENGYLDGNKLMTTLQSMDARATRAEQAAAYAAQQTQAQQQQTRAREEKEATLKVYEKYPQLDPTNKETFDPKMWQYVYNELASKSKRGEMPNDTDYMKAADTVYVDLYEGRDMTKKDKEEAVKKEEQKRQINATIPRSAISVGYYENQEESVLLNDVRNGKRGAVGALLRKRGM